MTNIEYLVYCCFTLEDQKIYDAAIKGKNRPTFERVVSDCIEAASYHPDSAEEDIVKDAVAMIENEISPYIGDA